MEKTSSMEGRKNDHIEINLHQNVNSSNTTGLEKFRLLHNALPEINYKEIDPSIKVFGKNLQFPFFISSMTGGTNKGAQVNRILAEAAERYQIAIGVGSQRIGIDDNNTMKTFQIRKYAPNTLIFSNLGAVQLNYGYSIGECRKAVEEIGADALILHLNPLQEVIMDNGNVNFKDLLNKIATICNSIQVPVIVKEVGWGISGKLSNQLYDAGVSAVDVAGAGGTSWSEVEKYRAGNPISKAIAEGFHDWGVSTTKAIIDCSKTKGKNILIASGGIKNGIDIVKCIALGADLCGIARPFLKKAVESEKSLDEYIHIIIEQLKIAMFAIGAQNLSLINGVKIETI